MNNRSKPKFYTFRGKHSGRMYYATATSVYEAARTISIAFKDLILERSENLPVQPPLPEKERLPI